MSTETTASPKHDPLWFAAYVLGGRADVKGEPREPPEHLSDELKRAWLRGYDR